MPTKHKRKRDTDDKSHYDLPPTTKARSLPVIAPTKDFLVPRKKQKLDDGPGRSGKAKKTKTTDDTPKAFARLMAWHTQGRKLGGGLDDGKVAAKKQKQKPKQKKPPPANGDSAAVNGLDSESQSQPQPQSSTPTPAIPKILPGETLTEFAIRVDQSMPLSGLAKSNTKTSQSLPADLREKEKKLQKLTKHNKRLAIMQSEWRNTEAKLKAREEADAEDNVEKLEEEKLLWDGVRVQGKKGKRKVVHDDPWKELEKKRRVAEKQKGAGVAGLSAKDQAQAPPEFSVKKLKPFKEVSDTNTQGAKEGLGAARNVGTWQEKRARRRDELDAMKRTYVEATKRQAQTSSVHS